MFHSQGGSIHRCYGSTLNQALGTQRLMGYGPRVQGSGGGETGKQIITLPASQPAICSLKYLYLDSSLEQIVGAHVSRILNCSQDATLGSLEFLKQAELWKIFF